MLGGGLIIGDSKLVHPCLRGSDRLRREQPVVRLGGIDDQHFGHKVRTSGGFQVSEAFGATTHDLGNCADELAFRVSSVDQPLIADRRIFLGASVLRGMVTSRRATS